MYTLDKNIKNPTLLQNKKKLVPLLLKPKTIAIKKKL